MSPEYAWTGTFSEKSDIYSFGVLMVEIITGKEISSFSYGKDGKNLLSYVRTTQPMFFLEPLIKKLALEHKV